LIDDQEIVRIGLRQVIGGVFPTGTCGEARSSQEALQLASQQDWDLVLLELAIDGNRGLELLKEMKRDRPKMPVLVVSSHPEEQYALRVIRAGAAGYISKASASAELLRAVKAVINGGRYVSQSLAEALSADLHRRDPQAIHETLSDREFQVMRLIGSGKTVGEIAGLLGISDKTVSTYRARVLDKTGMRNNAELVRYVVEQGLAD
jgi:two-component system invasion response regulator UvrY